MRKELRIGLTALVTVGAVGAAAYTEPWYEHTDTVHGVVITGELEPTTLGVCPDETSRGLIEPIEVWRSTTLRRVTDAAENNSTRCEKYLSPGATSYGDIEECVRPDPQFTDSLRQGDIVVRTTKKPRFPRITWGLLPTCVWKIGGNISGSSQR